MRIDWTPKIPKPFHILYETVVDEIIARSGRVSGKSFAFRDYCFQKLLEKKGNHVVVTRAEQNDIRLSVFAMFESLIYELGMDKLFKITKSPFEITFLPYGNRIFFQAINGNINRTKGFTIPFGHLAVVWHEEAQEMDNEMYLEAANTTYVRFFDTDSKTLTSYNPPEGIAHWANIYFPKKVQMKDALEIYSTWEDIKGLLTGQTIKKILQMKRNDFEYYKYWYLGHIITLRGAVFRMFNKAKHVIKQIDSAWFMSNVHSFIVSVDGAIKNDATCLGIGAVMKDGRMIIMDSYYYDPKVTGVQMDDLSQARKMAKWFAEGFMKRFPMAKFKPWIGTVDNANFNLMLMLKQTQEFGFFTWQATTDKNILRDTKRLQNMFSEDLIYIFEHKTNANHIGVAQIQSYIYDLEKNGEIKANQEDHYIDMLKYMTFHYRYGTAYKV